MKVASVHTHERRYATKDNGIDRISIVTEDSYIRLKASTGNGRETTKG